MVPIAVLVEQNIPTTEEELCALNAPRAFFERVDVPIPRPRSACCDSAIFQEVLQAARPAVERFWDQCKDAAQGLGQMFASLGQEKANAA